MSKKVVLIASVSIGCVAIGWAGYHYTTHSVAHKDEQVTSPNEQRLLYDKLMAMKEENQVDPVKASNFLAQLEVMVGREKQKFQSMQDLRNKNQEFFVAKDSDFQNVRNQQQTLQDRLKDAKRNPQNYDRKQYMELAKEYIKMRQDLRAIEDPRWATKREHRQAKQQIRDTKRENRKAARAERMKQREERQAQRVKLRNRDS